MSASILVVEDEAIIARDIKKTLEGLGYVVPPPVASGRQALDSVIACRPDLVLMDIRIQGEMDGIETAALIREKHGTPIIYLTSYSDDATLTRAKVTGAYGYLLKPFEDRELRVAIEVALQKRELEVALHRGEQIYRAIARHLPGNGAVTVVDRELRYVSADGPVVDDIARRMNATTLVGRSVAEVASAENRESVLNVYKSGLAGESRFLEIERGDRFFDMHVVPILDGAQASHVLALFYDVTDRKAQLLELERARAAIELHARELEEASVTDELTGLLNRRGFMLIGEREMKVAIRNKQKVVLFFADLNGMKTINDTFGHTVGDRALVDTASLLRGVFRTSDVIARLGGDEFVVLAIDAAATSGPSFAARLKEALVEYNASASPFQLSLSMGVSLFDPADPSTLEALLSQADAQMYEEKQRHRPPGSNRMKLT